MANEQHLKLIKQGVRTWNAWRDKEDRDVHPDLEGVDLSGPDLNGVDFSFTNLNRANLQGGKPQSKSRELRRSRRQMAICLESRALS